MFLSPFVRLQLRMAARRKLPGGLRGLSGLCLGAVVLGGFNSHFHGPVAGATVFLGLLLGWGTVSGLLVCAGRAADCVSSEKRQGTLGLLFQTGLSSAEIVVGKLAGLASLPLYCLLATLPAFACLLSLGGISWSHFLFVIAWLVLLIFWSLAIGLLASCLARSSAIAGLLAVFFLANQTVVPLLSAAFISSTYNDPAAARLVSIPSPLCALGYLTALPPFCAWYGYSAEFCAWETVICLLAASLLLGRAKVEGKVTVGSRVWKALLPARHSKPGLKHGLVWELRHGGRVRQKHWRHMWLARNPVYWLARRDRLLGGLARLIFYAGFAFWLVWFVRFSFFARDDYQVAAMFWECALGGFFLQQLLVCLLAVLATATLCELRLSGQLGTLALAPASSRLVADGNQLLLAEFARLPLVFLLVIGLVLIASNQYGGVADGRFLALGLESACLLVLECRAIHWCGLRTALQPGAHLAAIFGTIAWVVFPSMMWLLVALNLVAGALGRFGSYYVLLAWWWIMTFTLASLRKSRREVLSQLCELIDKPYGGLFRRRTAG